MNITVTAVGAQIYSFNDRDTGRLVEGITVYYLEDAKHDNKCGKLPQKISISDCSQWGEIKNYPFPCPVDVLTEQRLGGKGVYSKTIGVILKK